MKQADLFAQSAETRLPLAADAFVLPAFCLKQAEQLWLLIQQQLAISKPRQMMTPMGYQMSVKTASLGKVGWVSDQRAYGYATRNPVNGADWPVIPVALQQLATQAAAQAGYPQFAPDTCLINLYTPGAKMGLHQDKDEQDFSQPIVSVSLGIAATFLFGGLNRRDVVQKTLLQHGDVVVFGGQSRLNYHGIARVKQGSHPLLGPLRCNLTFRKAT